MKKTAKARYLPKKLGLGSRMRILEKEEMHRPRKVKEKAKRQSRRLRDDPQEREALKGLAEVADTSEWK
jgi:hypothetical protein